MEILSEDVNYMSLSDNNQPRIGVIGAGPVGLVLVAHLIEAGAFVVPCDIIPGRMEEIKKKGVFLKHSIEKHVQVPEVAFSINELESYDLDMIVVAVKTPHLTSVIRHLTNIANGKMKVIVAQNGIDNEIEVARAIGEERVLRMVINFAGAMSSPNTVHVSFFNPPNYIAALSMATDQVAEDMAKLLNSVDLTTEVPVDIQDYVWEKAILNAALSAVCAITRTTMKDVMDFPALLEIVESLIDEAVAVAEREGIELGNKFRRFSIRYLKNAGHHRPSMLVDLENGHPTEIDRLNGRIVHYGRKHCLPTPLNQVMTALVHMLESKAG